MAFFFSKSKNEKEKKARLIKRYFILVPNNSLSNCTLIWLTSNYQIIYSLFKWHFSKIVGTVKLFLLSSVDIHISNITSLRDSGKTVKSHFGNSQQLTCPCLLWLFFLISHVEKMTFTRSKSYIHLNQP